jgi:hypothetical protein
VIEEMLPECQPFADGQRRQHTYSRQSDPLSAALGDLGSTRFCFITALPADVELRTMAKPRKARGGTQPEILVRSAPADAPPTRGEARTPTHEEIELRAYHIWASAFHDSDPLANWLLAEEQLWYEYAVQGFEQVEPGRAQRSVPDEQRADRPV